MNPLDFGVAGFLILMLVFNIYVDGMSPFSFRLCTFWALWWSGLAVMQLLAYGDHRMTMLADGITAAWWGHNAWKRRPPRKRKPSKVAASIRDLGHRLVLVPASGGG